MQNESLVNHLVFSLFIYFNKMTLKKAKSWMNFDVLCQIWLLCHKCKNGREEREGEWGVITCSPLSSVKSSYKLCQHQTVLLALFFSVSCFPTFLLLFSNSLMQAV